MQELKSYTNLTDDFRSSDYEELASYSDLTDDLGAGTVIIIAPTEGQTDFDPAGNYDWLKFLEFTRYRLKTSTTADFNDVDIVQEQDVNATQLLAALQAATNYWTKVIPLKDVTDPTSGEITGTSITPSTTEVVEGEELTLTGNVEGSGTFNSDGTWTKNAGGDDFPFVIDGNDITFSPTVGEATESATFKFEAENGMFTERTITVTAAGTFGDSKAGDEAALVAMYNALDGANWDNNTGWDGTSMSLEDTIYGVTTYTPDAELRVRSIKLNGSEGINFTTFIGDDGVVGGNGLTGVLPSECNNFRKCQYFNVKQNAITGAIPSHLLDIQEMRSMLLNGVLEDIDPDSNYHPGKPSLVEERSNQFTDTMPAMNMPNLILLEIAGKDNQTEGLSGGVPSGIGLSTGLKGFNLHYNQFSQVLPPEMSNNTAIKIFCFGVQRNPQGVDTYAGLGLPAYVGTWLNLRNIWLGQLACGGAFPDLSSLNDFHIIDMDGCDFTGAYPAYLVDGRFPNINMIQSGSNDFTGDYPTVDANNNLAAFTVDINEFDVQELTDAKIAGLAGSKLSNFGFGWNSFIGGFPDVSICTGLRYLRANSNDFDGAIPFTIGDIPSSSFASIYLSNNQFSDYEVDSGRGHGFISPVVFSGGDYVSGLRRVGKIECHNNSLPESAVDKMILDTEALLLSREGTVYERDITIRLEGNTAPSSAQNVQDAITYINANGSITHD